MIFSNEQQDKDKWMRLVCVTLARWRMQVVTNTWRGECVSACSLLWRENDVNYSPSHPDVSERHVVITILQCTHNKCTAATKIRTYDLLSPLYNPAYIWEYWYKPKYYILHWFPVARDNTTLIAPLPLNYYANINMIGYCGMYLPVVLYGCD